MKVSKTNLRKNDRVIVLAGKDKAKVGKIIEILPGKYRARVEGINIIKKHTKPGPGSKGGIVEKEASIHISNLMLLCPKCTKPTRISHKFLENGKKIRVCKKCGDAIPDAN
ncbi:MAG: 50S ribosomal protein L24 [Dissulfurimicrobium sp.]|uniref:50S ribosomal protein L24 n=1 Tax=Dissulfurimicrobium TaxID=1769732 RepID=UPI001EDC8247|nr:50S ribosomal protein L24 [Dissulfurimicrobium hydrothermale]UKL14330.1 50S ribosomal protein L24 [Dissulfurimicrobium hydrothermale]